MNIDDLGMDLILACSCRRAQHPPENGIGIRLVVVEKPAIE